MADGIELYLIRHGLAAERGEAWPDDAKRPLTGKGLSRLRREARALEKFGISFDQIVTSPLVRARQTAEVFADGLSSHPPTAHSEVLAPGGTPAQVIQELGKFSRRKRIALVGHEPNLCELAARLLGARGAIEFKKGSIGCIEVAALPPTRPGTLLWLVTPKMLRLMAR
jgi:phosphohistidine phosphatase